MKTKSEISVSKLELLARKIASRAISLVPKEYIVGDNGESLTDRVMSKKIRILTDTVAENTMDILEGYNEETIDYLSFALIRSNTIRVITRDDADINQDRLSAHLKKELDDWRNHLGS